MTAIKGASSYSGRRQFLTVLADKGINVYVIQVLVFDQATLGYHSTVVAQLMSMLS